MRTLSDKLQSIGLLLLIVLGYAAVAVLVAPVRAIYWLFDDDTRR